MRTSNFALSVLMTGWALAAGCASSTPAQELAWVRWKTCDHFATVRLDRIQLDGRIVATAAEYEAVPFTECVQRVAAEQVRQGLPVGPDSAAVMGLEGIGVRGSPGMSGRR